MHSNNTGKHCVEISRLKWNESDKLCKVALGFQSKLLDTIVNKGFFHSLKNYTICSTRPHSENKGCQLTRKDLQNHTIFIKRVTRFPPPTHSSTSHAEKYNMNSKRKNNEGVNLDIIRKVKMILKIPMTFSSDSRNCETT